MRSDRPIWTPVYFWFGQSGGASETGTGYTRKVYDADGKLLGVLVVDVTLGAVSRHLHESSFAEKGRIFVIDDLGLLVAASHGAVNSAQGQRLRLSESNNPAGPALASAMGNSGASSAPRS